MLILYPFLLAQKLLSCLFYAKTIIIRLSFRYPIIPSLPKKEKRLPFPRLQNKI
jgi:hypothetical protein